MKELIAFMIFLCLSASQTYLPKDGIPPMSDLYSKYMSRLGKTQFWKTKGDHYSYVTSSFPVRPNSVTEITFLLMNGSSFDIGCAQVSNCSGKVKTYIGYSAQKGEKITDSQSTCYGSAAVPGDKITMTVDLRPFEHTVSFARNGLSMGIAFGGLNFWGDAVYLYFGVRKAGHRISILDYRVTG